MVHWAGWGGSLCLSPSHSLSGSTSRLSTGGGWAVRCPRPSSQAWDWLQAVAGGPCPLSRTLGGLNLSGSSPVALIVHGSLATRPRTLASVHRPLPGQLWPWTALAVDSKRRRFRDAGHPGAGLANPENTSRLSPPAFLAPVRRAPRGHADGSATPRGSAEGGALPGSGSQPPLRPHAPFTGLGSPSLGGQDTGRKRENPVMVGKKKEDTTRAIADLRSSSSPPRRAAGGSGLLCG